jgi:hypothetical protein
MLGVSSSWGLDNIEVVAEWSSKEELDKLIHLDDLAAHLAQDAPSPVLYMCELASYQYGYILLEPGVWSLMTSAGDELATPHIVCKVERIMLIHTAEQQTIQALVTVLISSPTTTPGGVYKLPKTFAEPQNVEQKIINISQVFIQLLKLDEGTLDFTLSPCF